MTTMPPSDWSQIRSVKWFDGGYLCTDLTVVPGEKFIVNRIRVISCLSSLWLQYKCILLRDKEERNCKRFYRLATAGKRGMCRR